MLFFVVETVIKTIVVFGVFLLFCAYLTLAERKILGHIQVRIGPNRVGPWGLLQPIADGLKALFKEEVVPERSDKVLFIIAPMISVSMALCLMAVIPFGDHITLFGKKINLVIANSEIGLLYLFAFASLADYGVVIGGWSSYNKYGLLGGLRAAAQMISYEIALGLSCVGVIMISGSLNLVDIVKAQAGGHWNVIYQPIAFIFYIICALAEINRTPFDMPEAESELACGYNIEYSSMKFSLFFIGEYAHLMIVAAVATTLFLGGWHGPYLPSVVWFLIKTFLIVFFFMWQRGTFPRLRYDRIMMLGWKVLLPLTLANIFVTGLVMVLAR
ncbi:MAG: NADH-quinone oxidoreductase subunit NuoH [Deltaproteobacteria bacterium]|nr:NADH-quinone oxidoreductase subunit NuoH [Deltaproteobacteria bacterium]